MELNPRGEISDLVNTNCDPVLLVKISVLGLLLTVAAMNKLRLVPAMRCGNYSAMVHLRHSINAEWVLDLSIVLVRAVRTRVTFSTV